MRIFRRLLAFGLALTLVFGLWCGGFPVRAAPRNEAWDGSVDISWYDPDATEFYISKPAELAGLAALVNGMTDPTCPRLIGDRSLLVSVIYEDFMLVGAGGGNVTDTVYGSLIDFAYKTVYITSDMDMGGVYSGGSWSGPNWTPIGGKYPMKPEVTHGDAFVLDTRFNGVLDGQGHTISNIFCDRFAAKGFPHSQAVGLVGYLGGLSDTEAVSVAEFENGWQPSVRNIIIGSGLIYGRRMVGGIAGRGGDTSNGVIIENCANSADIRNTDSRGIGGIVGFGTGSGVIRNCYNTGSVTTTYACPAGGIIGSNSGLDIFNCYSIGTIDSSNTVRGRGIGGHDSGSYTVDNCFYLEGSDDDPDSRGYFTGNSRRITVNVTSLTSEEMKTAQFIDQLNVSGTVFVADDANINNGFPILFFQAEVFVWSGSYMVSVEQPTEGGTLSADIIGDVALGLTVTMSADADAGWRLRYFTLDGMPLNANTITVSADSRLSAVFARVRQSAISLPEIGDSLLSFTKTGFEMSGGEMIYVENKLIRNGETLLEENIIHVSAIPYAGHKPEDPDLEYTGSYVITAVNAERNPDGTYTVTGEGNVSFSVTQSTAVKSWINLADTSWYTGQGDTYTITTARQLAGMARLVNVEGVSFEGITLLLGNDISLKNDDGTMGERIWAACGRNINMSFSGTFDGQGYSIYDMTAYSAGSYAGLFGYCSGAVIRNVTVRGTVRGDASTSYAAGIAAYASGSIIENCTNRADIFARGVGAAGIAAFICDETTVTGCVNRAPISGTTGVGGIVGIVYSGSDVVKDSHNYGEINAAGDGSYGAGGIAGQLAGLIDGCGNFASVTSADRFTGGLAGYATSRIHTTISNSVTTGAVSSNSSNRMAAVGAAVGYAQHLNLENVSASSEVSAGANFISAHTGGLIGREGSVTRRGREDAGIIPSATQDSDTWTRPIDKPAPWSITFMADGQVVHSQTYSSASESITAPEVPEKSGFTASWASFALGDRDLIVQAVYRPVIVRGGDTIAENGVYYVDPSASGVITVSAGLTVTLNGLFGIGDSLSVRAGSGVDLTLDNLRLIGDRTLLTLGGGSLILSGGSTLISQNDARGNENPTIRILGDLTVSGTGSLYVSVEAGNSAIKLDPGISLHLMSGTLTAHKNGLLGETGGVLYANEASVSISGGVFNSYSFSDNVLGISVRELSITGGTVRIQARKSPVAIGEGEVTIDGGTLTVFGHTGDGHGYFGAYHGTEAISGLRGAASGTFEQILPFDDVFVTEDYYEAVRMSYNAGYLTGITDTEFMPGEGITRAVLVTALLRADSGNRRAANENTSRLTAAGFRFSDVAADAWYSDAVAWAVNNGITTGTSDTTFSPEAYVTVEQLALFLCRFYELSGQTASPSSGDFGAGSSHWARAASAWAVENSILPAGVRFKDNADRAMLAGAMYSLQSLMNNDN